MNKEYKKIYDLVLSLGFIPAYIHFSRGYFSLDIFSKDYTIFEGQRYSFMSVSLEELRKDIIEVLK